MVWLELNTIESKRSLSNILSGLTLVGKRVYIANAREYYTNVHPLLYSLHKYARKYFISVATNRENENIVVNIISSEPNILDKAINNILLKKAHVEKEKELSYNEINELVNTKKYILLDFYFKLALRNYLYSINYQPKIVGSRTAWSSGSNDILYFFDADIDPLTFKGYISVDIRFPSSTTLWDKIVSESLGSNEIWELIDSNVMVPYGNKYAYGKICGFIHKRVSEDIDVNGEKLNLFEYYMRKGIRLDPDEQPIVEIEIISPESRRGRKPLYYPPSQVRIFLPIDVPEPHTRYDRINGVLEKLIENFSIHGIRFRKAVIRYEHKKYVNVIRDVVLKYGNRESYISPLFSMQKLNTKPLHGPVNVPKLFLLLPNTVSKEVVGLFSKLIQLLYESYNLGTIGKVEVCFYKVHEDPANQKVEFSSKLKEILEKNKPTDTLVMPVINRRYLFKIAKQICSDKSYHARVLEEETFAEIIELILDFQITNEEKINEYINTIKKEKITDKQLEQLTSMLSNIVFSIYVEFLLQSEIYKHRVPSKLTWALAEPADGSGKSLYIGYDVSRSPINRNEVAVAFVLYDSYGYMLNAIVKQIRGEKLSKDVFESILLSLLEPLQHEESMERLVIYKDGGIRGKQESNEIIEVFSSIGRKIGLKQIDVIGIIKRHNLRLFAKRKQEKIMDNPSAGTWIKIWDIIKYGVYAERALIISSEAKSGGTVKPVLLERYTREYSNKTINELVNEYFRLCRLDYWNPLDGMNKYPLPIFMADKLAYLALQNIQIKTP